MEQSYPSLMIGINVQWEHEKKPTAPARACIPGQKAPRDDTKGWDSRPAL